MFRADALVVMKFTKYCIKYLHTNISSTRHVFGIFFGSLEMVIPFTYCLMRELWPSSGGTHSFRNLGDWGDQYGGAMTQCFAFTSLRRIAQSWSIGQ